MYFIYLMLLSWSKRDRSACPLLAESRHWKSSWTTVQI